MKDDSAGPLHRPRPSLSVLDAISILIGIVIGVGIFKAPSVIAANVTSEWIFLAVWIAGALISLVGALCYAEMAASHPHVGGEYHFLACAYGQTPAFLFAWGRLSVIQTGAIAAVAFVLGDYASLLLPLGAYSPAIYAALAIAGLTAFNLSGLAQSKWLQNMLTITLIAAMAAIIVVGFTLAPAVPVRPVEAIDGANTIGLAMVFVLLTFGGWNEVVYLAAEVRDVQRNMVRILVIGLGMIAGIYLLLNLAYLNVLGLQGMRGSEVVAADMLRSTIGERGALLVTLAIAAAALTTLNGTIFTGARSSYAFGKDFPLFSRLGRWNDRAMTPANAFLLQGAIALLLVGLGAVTRKGFATMVEYTAPVFWLFFLLSACSLFVLRLREPDIARPFKVPLYPVTPAIFCITCAYMLYASIAYTGIGALLGGAVLLAGVPLLFLSRQMKAPPEPEAN